MPDRLAPSEALERILDVIRQEAAENPSFAKRLAEAGFVETDDVARDGAPSGSSHDPVLAAARGDSAAFRAQFLKLPVAELKAIIKTFRLATESQVKGVTGKPKQAGLVDLMWDGARRKLAERSVR